MKKDRNAQKYLNDLYFFLDFEERISDTVTDEQQKRYDILEEKFAKKFGNRYSPIIAWTEYYGLFYDGNKRVYIDPKRYKKMLELTNDQYLVMCKKEGSYFHPKKKAYFDYGVNVLVDEIRSIREDFKKTYKPIIDKSVNNIKQMKTVYPGDDPKFMMGISGSNAANARANFINARNEQKLKYKKFELYNSLYAQFFHSMTSRIEAATVHVYSKQNPKMKDFNRNCIYINMNNKDESPRDLPSFKYHDKMYSIWNFIKHNNMNQYETVKKNYPEVLVDAEYKSGDLAIRYLKLNEKLILELLDGTERFFVEWCELNLSENYSEAQWNYDEWFINQVEDKIDSIMNPLDLDMFDEID